MLSSPIGRAQEPPTTTPTSDAPCPADAVGIMTMPSTCDCAPAWSYNVMTGFYTPMMPNANYALQYMPSPGYYGPSLPPDSPGMYTTQYGTLAPGQMVGSFMPTTTPSYAPRPSHAYPMAGKAPPVTVEELRKVIVKCIQPKATPQQVETWVRHQIGEYSSAIIVFNVPRGDRKDRIRGKALITLSTAAAAEATARILDQKMFQSQVVSAHVTSEGITETEKQQSRPSRPWNRRPGQGKARAEETGRMSDVPDLSTYGWQAGGSKNAPGTVIVNGSSRRHAPRGNHHGGIWAGKGK